tara:strand:+ start:485 stop:1036 length:552 start_codon:yes stop_codon:yes gene_type:complete
MKSKLCEICNKIHKEFTDPYEWYNHYLKYNPKNTEKEIWDMVKKKWIKVLAILCLMFVGCEDLYEDKSDVFLELSTDLTMVDEGVYAFAYPLNIPHTYIRIKVRSNPLNRVSFYSPNTFTIVHQGRDIISPIINYSVYTKSDSTSRQFVYVYRDHIGETFKIYGLASDGNGNTITDSLYIQIY